MQSQGRKAQKVMRKDGRLAKLAGLLKANNPFTVVFDEIDKMIDVIEEEQKADEKKFDLCKKQTDEGEKALAETNDEIDNLEQGLDKLHEAINKHETGLKDQEALIEEAMQQNVRNQEESTSNRRQENMMYQKNVKELAMQAELIERAIHVLKKFYDSLDENSGVVEAEGS